MREPHEEQIKHITTTTTIKKQIKADNLKRKRNKERKYKNIAHNKYNTKNIMIAAKYWNEMRLFLFEFLVKCATTTEKNEIQIQ